jgi:hypothetical protein
MDYYYYYYYCQTLSPGSHLNHLANCIVVPLLARKLIVDEQLNRRHGKRLFLSAFELRADSLSTVRGQKRVFSTPNFSLSPGYAMHLQSYHLRLCRIVTRPAQSLRERALISNWSPSELLLVSRVARCHPTRTCVGVVSRCKCELYYGSFRDGDGHISWRRA